MPPATSVPLMSPRIQAGSTKGRTVCGLIAGKLTKSNIIGYIGSFPIPEVVSGINAFTLALRSVNPEAQVRVVWVNSWYDPGKEAAAANADRPGRRYPGSAHRQPGADPGSRSARHLRLRPVVRHEPVRPKAH